MLKIEDLSDGGYDNEDDDTQDLDLKQYKNVIKSKSSASQAIIKVDSIEEGFDPRTNKVENFSENSNVGIILTSPESDPHCESPGILKRSKKRTTCTRTIHTSYNNMVDASVSNVSVNLFPEILRYIFYTTDELFHASVTKLKTFQRTVMLVLF
jgi:hypothetical protein